LDKDLVALAKKRGVGEVAKIPYPGFGKLFFPLQERSGEGGQPAGEVGESVVSPSGFCPQLPELREIHMRGQVQPAGIGQRILKPLVVADRGQGAGRTGRGVEKSGRKSIIQRENQPAGDFFRPTLHPSGRLGAKLHRVTFDLGRMPVTEVGLGLRIGLPVLPPEPGILRSHPSFPPGTCPELQDFHRKAVHQLAGVK